MSDTGYLLCLAGTGICAILAPMCARNVLSGRSHVEGCVTVVASSVIGLACSWPFQSTREMPWLPAVAACYFGTVILTAILFGVSEILQALRSRDGEDDE